MESLSAGKEALWPSATIRSRAQSRATLWQYLNFRRKQELVIQGDTFNRLECPLGFMVINTNANSRLDFSSESFSACPHDCRLVSEMQIDPQQGPHEAPTLRSLSP